MIRFFLLGLAAIVAGLLLALNLANDPGYILIAYGNYTFETSLFALLVALLIILVVLKLLLTLLGALNPARLFRRSPKSAVNAE